MANTDLAVRIATILDATGLNKADKAIGKFEKNVKNLGRTLGIALSGAAITAFGKSAVKAFAADEAAAQRLATAVDNLGLSFFKTDVEDFIAKTEQSAGILDDKLRPAMQALLTTTGSLTKSQELLNNAIQISRASGVDLATVAQDLASGYVGITRGLRKYNTGLTQAELKTKSFSEILGVLLTRSAGAADSYLETTAYKMQVLTVASENAKETIGKGLVDAFAQLGGGSSAADAAKTLDSIAKAVAGVTTAVGIAAGALVKLYKAFDFIGSLGGLLGENGTLLGNGKPKVNTNRQSSPAGSAIRTRQQREAEAAAAKRAKELAGLQKKQAVAQKALTAEQKKQNALKRAGSIFDLDQIQLIAALKGQLTEEERKRIELQLALLTGNVSEAQRLTREIAIAQGLGTQLANYLATLPDAKNPFASWKAYLDMLEAQAARIAAMPTGGGAPQGNVPNTNPFPDPSASQPEIDRERGNFYGSGNVGGTVVVQIDGRTIGNALLDQSMSAGQVAYLDRRTGGFG
jgi:hypothetical protein